METHQTRLDRTSEPADTSPAAAGGFAAETAALPAGFWRVDPDPGRDPRLVRGGAGTARPDLEHLPARLPGGAQLLGSEVEFDLALCAVLHTG